MENQIPNKFFELYGKKAFTADVQAETIAQQKAEIERLKKLLEEKGKVDVDSCDKKESKP